MEYRDTMRRVLSFPSFLFGHSFHSFFLFIHLSRLDLAYLQNSMGAFDLMLFRQEMKPLLFALDTASMATFRENESFTLILQTIVPIIPPSFS